jgi:glutathione synthase/RimK-type ligase-like ATP-grasp enzyme
MTKIGIATCARLPDLIESDQALVGLFLEKNIKATPVVWNDSAVDFRQFDAILIRSIWDYFLHENDFNAWLDFLEKNKIPLFNSVKTVRENQHKFYLKTLSEKGVSIIPTIFLEKTDALDLSFIAEKNWSRCVIKPAISAGSHETTLFNLVELAEIEEKYRAFAKNNDLLVQPFMPEIQETGEFSFIFFDKKFSHAIQKTPKSGDFRIQSQFGGVYQIYEPSEAILQTATNILKQYSEDLLYARVDGIVRDGQLLLMEIELIEPDLYFDFYPEKKAVFVNLVAEKLAKIKK